MRRTNGNRWTLLRVPEIERFMKHVQKAESGCWEWSAHINYKGYGMFKADDKLRSAHRWHYFYSKKLNPDDSKLCIDHLCRNRKCVNPEHLDLVTSQENTKRGIAGLNQRLKTHCPHGHPYTQENLVKAASGKRRCKTCERAYAVAYKEKKSAKK